jgi:adenylate kinase
LVVVQENILNELEYQSSLELDPRTFHSIGEIPLASQIVQHARRDLVRRLDEYEYDHSDLFHSVVELIESKLVPIVLRHAISGRATVSSEDEILENPLALQMLIDVFSERGYHAVIDLRRREIPEKIDLQTGEISCRQQKVYRIAIYFKGSEIRRGE